MRPRVLLAAAVLVIALGLPPRGALAATCADDATRAEAQRLTFRSTDPDIRGHDVFAARA